MTIAHLLSTLPTEAGRADQCSCSDTLFMRFLTLLFAIVVYRETRSGRVHDQV